MLIRRLIFTMTSRGAMTMDFKKIGTYINYFIIFYILYAFIFGVLIFALHKPKNSKYLVTHPVDRFYGEGIGQDRAVLVEDRYYSGLVRVDLIERAEETLDISYYTIHDGISTDIFLGSILEAADRGVKVRFILDGMFHHLEGNLKDVIYAFTDHPNIELKFYEPFTLLKPWTWNNRLHDKFIIADSKLAIIGGRNIGDKYFVPQNDLNIDVVYDRDVLILNTDEVNYHSSVIFQLEDYFNQVWKHEFSKYPTKKLTKRQHKKGNRKAQYLMDKLESMRKTNPEIFNNSYDWMDLSLPTKKITLIHNPIERLNKEPWCWYELVSLAEKSQESILIQSPYIIPTNSMVKYLEDKDITAENIDILTNSLAVSPNPFAISGYMNHRKDIVDSNANVYEFQGPGSIHAKSCIFDNRISAVGSFNFDSRSVHLSTETMVVIDSEQFAEHLEEEIQNYIGQSLKIGKDYNYIPNPIVEEQKVSIPKKIIVSILSIIVYFFEFML